MQIEDLGGHASKSNNLSSLMDMRLTYNNNHSIWTVIDSISEFLHIEFGWSFFCNLHFQF